MAEATKQEFDQETINWIRETYKPNTGRSGVTTLAEMFKVEADVIYGIVKKRTHIEDPMSGL